MSQAAPSSSHGAQHARQHVLMRLKNLAEEDPSTFYEMALRLRSSDVLDAVAAQAVRGAHSAALLEVGRALHSGMSLEPLSILPVSSSWLSQLATLTAVAQTRQTPDLPAALGLWAWAEQAADEDLPQSHRDVRAQASWLYDGRSPQLEQWLRDEEILSEPVRLELRADLENPWVTDPGVASTPTWTAALGTILGPRLAPVDVPSGSGAPFDRLSAPSATLAHGSTQPRIAVILTTYRPDETLLTAVRSVIAQTWTEWRLLIVDDASGPEFESVLQTAAGLDPRISLLRQESNGGTYRARNAALRALPECDYVTFHDSDDWSHPQRLELTVAPLEADPSLVAVTTWAQKSTETLELSRLGYRGISRMAAGLVVRRDPVLSTLGFFDPVRKSADKEFQRRIAVAFPDRTTEVTDPIAMVRRGQGSLSSADHSRGWRHHSRRHYQQAYQPWHRKIRRGEVSPYLDDQAARLFWAPARWLDAPPPERYDVVLVADFSAADADVRLEPHVRQAVREHEQVGLLQLDAPVLLSGPEPGTHRAIRSRVTRGQASWVYLDDPVTVDKVSILDPTLLHPATDQVARWKHTGQVGIVPPPGDHVVEPRRALRAAERLFGATARLTRPVNS